MNSPAKQVKVRHAIKVELGVPLIINHYSKTEKENLMVVDFELIDGQPLQLFKTCRIN